MIMIMSMLMFIMYQYYCHYDSPSAIEMLA